MGADVKVTAYVSPESTYGVLRPLLGRARERLDISMYQIFSEGMLRVLERKARELGPAMRVLTYHGRWDESDGPAWRLQRAGALVRPSSHIPERGRINHAKFMVVDGKAAVVQTANLNGAGVPRNYVGGSGAWRPGNRECGVVIEASDVVGFCGELFEQDWARVGAVDGDVQPPSLAGIRRVPFFAEPTRRPAERFPARTFELGRDEIELWPLVTPEACLETMERLIGGARQSVWLMQQYIRPDDAGVKELVRVLKRKAARGVDVRILLHGLIYPKDVEDTWSLVTRPEFRAGKVTRFHDWDTFTRLHAKVVLVDGQWTMVGSQNWSWAGLGSNRELGIAIGQRKVAEYFGRVFAHDWGCSKAEYREMGRSTRFGVGDGNGLGWWWEDYV